MCIRDRVGIDAQLIQEIKVLRPATVGVARDVTGIAVIDCSGYATEIVPDGGPSAVLGDAAFDLVGRGCDSPAKIFGQGIPVVHGSSPEAASSDQRDISFGRDGSR